MMLRLQWKHHRRERVAGQPKKRKSCTAPGFARWRMGVTQAVQGFRGDGWSGFVPGGSCLARSLAVLCLVASSAGCILTGDLPDPALDVPQGYKSARSTAAVSAPPTLDWWRGFRSAELAKLMQEAQTVNLDIAAATARFVQADAQARIAGAALLPSLSGGGSETYSRTSGSSASGLSNGGREVVNYPASMSASYQLDFWGKNRDAAQAAEETAVANRFDRDVVALTTLTTVANAYFQVLASQDRIRTAQNNIASASASSMPSRSASRPAPAPTSTLRSRKPWSPINARRCRRCGKRSTRTSMRWRRWCRDHRRAVRVTGGTLNQIAMPRVTPGLPSELLTQRPDIRRQEAQLASATANVGSARAQFFPEHSVDRAGRLSEFGVVGSVPAPCCVLQPGRQR